MEFISIITAIHNGLSFNKIYWKSLQQFTHYPFEMIIIDNASDDGSGQFFENRGCKVIRNESNFSYPFCQNQGIRAATGKYLFFLNNDIVLSPLWDKHLVETCEAHGLDLLSASGIENMGDLKTTQNLDRRWKRIKNPLMIFGFSERNMRLMFRLMYGNWKRFCGRIFDRQKLTVVEGIVGNNVMMTRRGFEKIGLWDERMQSADFDLFMRAKKRSLETGDIQPCHIALGVFIHHFNRMTVKYSTKPKPFADGANLVPLGEKWSAAELDRLHPNNATIRKF
ncbi:MAG TPA: glycosyltransferase [Puia sp.]|nr:glycosyltransferase [Puia sp.]